MRETQDRLRLIYDRHYWPSQGYSFGQQIFQAEEKQGVGVFTLGRWTKKVRSECGGWMLMLMTIGVRRNIEMSLRNTSKGREGQGTKTGSKRSAGGRGREKWLQWLCRLKVKVVGGRGHSGPEKTLMAMIPICQGRTQVWRERRWICCVKILGEHL